MLTAAAATELIADVKTLDQLRALIAQIDLTSSGKVTILYSGFSGIAQDEGSPLLRGVDLVHSMINANEDIRVVDKTEVAKFLNIREYDPAHNHALVDFLKRYFGDSPSDPNSKSAAFLYGEVVDGVRRPNGVWDDVSARFVNETVGEIRTLTGGASAGRSFAQTEVPQILLSQTITAVDGIPIEQLRLMGPEKAFKAISAQSEVLSAKLKVGVDQLGKPVVQDGFLQVDARNFFASTPGISAIPPADGVPMRSMADFIPVNRLQSHKEGLEELRNLRNNYLEQLNALPEPEHQLQRLAILKNLDRLGMAAEVVDLALVAYQAKAAYEHGDTATAKSLLLEWAASAACGYLAGELASLAFAPLASAGPAGVALLTALSVSAGIAGSSYGDDLARWMQDLLRTWNDSLQDHFRDITFQPPGSPLILDLDGDGVETISRSTSDIHFDHNGDGLAERTGWVSADDALLVLDLDHDGQISNGSELFGNNAIGVDGARAAHGFSALAVYDSSHDGWISADDTAWKELRLWIDADSDAIADPGELRGLTEMGVQALSLNYATSQFYDLQGNQHRQNGQYLTAAGGIRAMTDVWFSLDTVRTLMVHPQIVNAEIAALPDLDCIGGLLSLHQAMARDTSGALAAVVRAWVAASSAQRQDMLDDLIYKWAGVDRNAVVDSSMSSVDGRQLALFYKVTGRHQLEDHGYIGTLLPVQIQDFYRCFRDQVELSLAGQADLLPMLKQINVVWSNQTQTPHLDAAPLARWLGQAMATGMDRDKLVLASKYLRNFWPSQPLATLHDAILTVAMREPAAVRTALFTLTVATSFLAGSGQDNIRGLSTDDLLQGNDGDDRLLSFGGQDILWGGPGADSLYGGLGDDRYVFDRGDGADLIGCDYDVRAKKNNVLLLGPAILPSDIKVTAARDGNDVVLQLAESDDKIVIEEFFADDQDSVDKCEVQTIQFANGTIWHEPDLRRLLPQATAGDDLLRGSIAADQIRGGAGQDRIYGGDGDDELQGDAGQDTLDGGAGSDRFVFARGWGQDLIYNTDNSLLSRDIVVFDRGILPAEIELTRAGLNLVFTLLGSKDRITAVDFFVADGRGANSWDGVSFADGTFWDADLIRSLVLIGRKTAQTLIGYATSDQIYAGAGNDMLLGMDGDDLLCGEAGDDWLAGYSGADSLSGGKGNDEYFYLRGDGSDVILADFDKSPAKRNRLSFGYSVKAEDAVLSMVGTDLLITFRTMTEAADQILVQDYCRDGDPKNAYNPIQEIRFDSGGVWSAATIPSRISNAVFGSEGADVLVGLDGNEWMSGLEGADTLVASLGDDWLSGGAGVDTLSFSNLIDSIQVNLQIVTAQNTGAAGVDTILSIENLIGGAGDDLLTGGLGANDLYGGPGNDLLDGGAGDDLLSGGTNGELGDTAFYGNAASAVRVDLSLDTAQRTGGAGVDRLTGIENLLGSRFADRLTGSDGANRIEGGDGNDIIRGGLGRDWLVGGRGSDRFVYGSLDEVGANVGARDVIADLGLGDRIDLGLIDANPLRPNNQSFVFIGASAFAAIGQLRYTTRDGIGFLEGNAVGDLAPDFALELLGAPELLVSSLIL